MKEYQRGSNQMKEMIKKYDSKENLDCKKYCERRKMKKRIHKKRPKIKGRKQNCSRKKIKEERKERHIRHKDRS